MKFLLCLLIAGAAFAKGKERKPAQVDTKSQMASVFVGYLKCKQDISSQKQIDAVRNCVAQFLPPKTPASKADRFSTWLILPIQIEKIRDCTAAEIKNGEFYPEPTNSQLCFDFEMDGVAKAGIVFFKTVKSTPYLSSIDYN